MAVIRSEILLSFQTIAFAEVQKVFLETYGENYDVDSLNNSLQLGLGNDLRPIFLYNRQVFRFSKNLKSSQRKFNQNSVSYASFGTGLEDPEFYSLDEYNSYEDDDDPFSDAFNEISSENIKNYKIFQPYNRINRQGGYASLEETYQKAKNDALDKFEKEYITHIKPRIIKKYGLKI